MKNNRSSISERIKAIVKNHMSLQQYLALEEGLIKLNKEGIACFFYNRIGLKKNFDYSDSAKRRMKSGSSFSVMFQDIDAYEEDLREIFGEKYSKEYIKKIGNIPQVVVKGNKYSHEDKKSELVNVVGGNRITIGMPQKYCKTIHIYGRCGVFGYAVEDADNMPSILQKNLLDNGYDNIRVVNHGMWGGSDKEILHNFIQDIQFMKPGDIVIFYQAPLKRKWMEIYQKCGLWYSDFTDEYHKFEETKWCFFDKPGHMNSIGYKIIADLIFRDLQSHGFAVKAVSDKELNDIGLKNYLNYSHKYINKDFYDELGKYIESVKKQYPVNNKDLVCGAIVMNCNPFTLGHKYLIEYARAKVDLLYIFVVEENKSFFSFEDRIEMVKLGTSSMDNVLVIPSGKFMISAVTFPEYFMKDYVKEKDFDVSADLEIFGRNIAPEFNITARFAGKEPLDVVTENYNRNMEALLPEYGIEFCEIPRLEDKNNNVVNATYVRELLKEKKYDEIREYVPETTYTILQECYMK